MPFIKIINILIFNTYGLRYGFKIPNKNNNILSSGCYGILQLAMLTYIPTNNYTIY